jgi:hypothetical protein
VLWRCYGGVTGWIQGNASSYPGSTVWTRDPGRNRYFLQTDNIRRHLALLALGDIKDDPFAFI